MKKILFSLLLLISLFSFIEVSAGDLTNEFEPCTIETGGYIECYSTTVITNDYYAIYIPDSYIDYIHTMTVVYEQYFLGSYIGLFSHEVSLSSLVNNWYVVDTSELLSSAKPERVYIELRIIDIENGKYAYDSFDLAYVNSNFKLILNSELKSFIDIYNSDEAVSYNDGYNDGYEIGQIDGYEMSGFDYDFGFDDGYVIGYNVGYDEDFDAYGWLTGLLYFIGALFNIEFIQGISLGTIAMFWIVLALLPILVGITIKRG